MHAYWTLVRRELTAYFYSWTGYVVIGGVLFLLGASFTLLIQSLNNEPTEQPVTALFYSTWYFWFILLIATPIITMRTFALEKYSGTFETLMTAPVSDLQVVLAKVTGAMVFYLIMWLPLLPCLLLVRHYSDDPGILDLGTVCSMYIGILLVGSVYITLGCFASAITRSQILAAMLSFAVGISLFLLSFVSLSYSSQTSWQARLFSYLSFLGHMQDFARGIVDSRPIVLYLTLSLLFLYLTLKVIEGRRWK